jgi:peptidoglycan/xylan/chitin deacetylase (PgdA/CDA1 family)
MSSGASVVLLYHRVADETVDPLGMCVSPARFEAQLEVIQRIATVVPATAIPTAPPRSLAITFDDGYADVFSDALPRLTERGIPSTIFLVTDHMQQGCAYWWDRLVYAIYGAGRSQPASVTIGGKARTFTLGNRVAKRIALRVLFPWLRAMNRAEREEVIAELEQGVPAMSMARVARVATMDDVQSASRGLVEIGSHTRSHPLLSATQGHERKDEIACSKQHLEEQLDVEARAFAYPFGARTTFDDETVREVREAGYACAFANIPGSVRPGDDVFRIPRRVVGDWPGPVLERRLRRWLGSD